MGNNVQFSLRLNCKNKLGDAQSTGPALCAQAAALGVTIKPPSQAGRVFLVRPPQRLQRPHTDAACPPACTPACRLPQPPQLSLPAAISAGHCRLPAKLHHYMPALCILQGPAAAQAALAHHLLQRDEHAALGQGRVDRWVDQEMGRRMVQEMDRWMGQEHGQEAG